MQACPYDALYIDPQTHTAAKCNYCAHRIDVGLEPACVNVCPTQAIVSGDLDNPNSKIATLKREQSVTARQVEKGTEPALFYIDAQEESLEPMAARPNDEYMWGSQSSGVGHFAGHNDEHALDRLGRLLSFGEPSNKLSSPEGQARKIVGTMSAEPKRAYDAPQKGILWGWQVSGYLWTKAISAGVIIVLLIAKLFGLVETTPDSVSFSISLVFLAITGALLVWDLDKPSRFLYVLLRPQWSSWLVRGAYIITVFAALLTAFGLFASDDLKTILGWPLLIFAGLTAVYTAWLFAQAKGRDWWQAPTLPWHMLIHSVLAGAAALAICTSHISPEWNRYLWWILAGSILLNLGCTFIDFKSDDHSPASTKVASSIIDGRYKHLFWIGAICIGMLLPLLLIILTSNLLPLVAVLSLLGVFVSQHILVRAPQQIPLS